jgi:hypothetical protein
MHSDENSSRENNFIETWAERADHIDTVARRDPTTRYDDETNFCGPDWREANELAGKEGVYSAPNQSIIAPIPLIPTPLQPQ